MTMGGLAGLTTSRRIGRKFPIEERWLDGGGTGGTETAADGGGGRAAMVGGGSRAHCCSLHASTAARSMSSKFPFPPKLGGERFTPTGALAC